MPMCCVREKEGEKEGEKGRERERGRERDGERGTERERREIGNSRESINASFYTSAEQTRF